MILTKAREFAVESARQPVNDVVLTIPGFFNQAERKSIMIAAEMAGLKVLQLLNDYTSGLSDLLALVSFASPESGA